MFAYTRTMDEKRLLCVCNYSDQQAAFELPAEFEGADCLITNLGRENVSGGMMLKPYECFVLYREQ